MHTLHYQIYASDYLFPHPELQKRFQDNCISISRFSSLLFISNYPRFTHFFVSSFFRCPRSYFCVQSLFKNSSSFSDFYSMLMGVMLIQSLLFCSFIIRYKELDILKYLSWNVCLKNIFQIMMNSFLNLI